MPFIIHSALTDRALTTRQAYSGTRNKAGVLPILGEIILCCETRYTENLAQIYLITIVIRWIGLQRKSPKG